MIKIIFTECFARMIRFKTWSLLKLQLPENPVNPYYIPSSV